MPVDGQQVVHQIYLKNLHMYTYDMIFLAIHCHLEKTKTKLFPNILVQGN